MEEKNTTVTTTEEEQEQEEEVTEKTDPQNTDTEDNKEGDPSATEDPNKPGEGQSKEEDARFAKLRHERDVARAKAAGDAEGYKRARIKSVGGKNPYTDTPIETDEDFELYELQDEIQSKGGDPKNVFEVEKLRREKAAEKARLEQENLSEEEKRQKKADAEVKEYLDEGHTREELQAYWNNPKFMEFAEDLIGAIPLKTIIAKFDKAYPKENKTTKKTVANKVSSPGSASNDEQEVPTKKISEMTREEFKAYMESVASGKTKIK